MEIGLRTHVLKIVLTGQQNRPAEPLQVYRRLGSSADSTTNDRKNVMSDGKRFPLVTKPCVTLFYFELYDS